MRRIIRATRNSWDGLRVAWQEAAFREEVAVLALSVPVAALIASNAWIWLALVGSLVLLMAIEILNTGLERLSDHVTPDIHPHIKDVKDLGSAAVGVTLALAAGVWLTAIAARIGVF
jgi:diacylglycerol kinase (ATP)